MNGSPPKYLLRHLNLIYRSISHPYTSLFVLIVIIGWFMAGDTVHFNEIWYKWFHIFEMTVTLLMIFIIESTVEADNRAMQEKLDEIIKKLPQTDNKMIGIEKEYKGEEE
ncbi:MAG: low affinity iron permease family protein [Candidatus Levyibacteriota bacterium]